MIKINKTNDEILPYTYLLKFKIDNEIKYYYGVRCGHVAKNIKPSDDLFKVYYSSSKYVKTLLNDGIFPFEIIIHKTFVNHSEASNFEIKFLKKINARHRYDILNQVDHFDNSLPNNKGRKLSEARKLEISKFSTEFQSSSEYRMNRSIKMKEKWSDPNFIEYMKERNNSFWNGDSETLKQFKIKRSIDQTGKVHSNETKLKLSLIHKELCSKMDCSARAMKRRRYKCPLCEFDNLDGKNFNSHMQARHEWDKDTSQKYKQTINEN
jgi:hypothetical protein